MSEMKDMNEGVAILLARMESNPEDFEYTGLERGRFYEVSDTLKKRLSSDAPKWDWFSALTAEEVEALTAAYIEMKRKNFTKDVMAKLLVEEKSGIDNPWGEVQMRQNTNLIHQQALQLEAFQAAREERMKQIKQEYTYDRTI